jgi:putative DNA primase/helicase
LAAFGFLTKDSSVDEINAAVREWAAQAVRLPLVEIVGQKGEVVRLLRAVGVRCAGELAQAALAEAKKTMEDTTSEDTDSVCVVEGIGEVMPWSEAVDGRELAGEIEAYVRKYVVLPDENAVIPLVLWPLAAHAHDSFQVFPNLVISSPVLRAGKTTVLMVLAVILPRVFFTSNTTAAALFKAIGLFKPTILVDEGDTFLTRDEALRGLVNSGHIRSLAYVTRASGTYSTWAPKVIALIGSVPKTIEDRSITIAMQRRAPNEIVERFRLDRLQEHEDLRRKAARWAQDHAEPLRGADPEVPGEINSDRARDNWRPILAIADEIGGEWRRRAREAAVALSGADETFDEEPRTLLIKDLDGLFRSQRADRLESRKIVKWLVAMPERPWGNYRHGRPLTEQNLAEMLKPFRVRSQSWVVPGAVKREWKRGYLLADLRDLFGRYVPK